jgi:hypothetical protein
MATGAAPTHQAQRRDRVTERGDGVTEQRVREAAALETAALETAALVSTAARPSGDSVLAWTTTGSRPRPNL